MTLKELYAAVEKLSDCFSSGDLVGAARCLLEIVTAGVEAFSNPAVKASAVAPVDAALVEKINAKFAECKANVNKVKASGDVAKVGAWGDGTVLKILFDAVERFLPFFLQWFSKK